MSARRPVRRNPYQGLVPFEEADAPFFFGRDRETSRILSHVIASRLTLLYGPSGVGKSSVLNAGVAHRLRAMAAADADDGLPPAHAVVSFGTWSGDPEPALVEASRRALRAVADGPLPTPDGPGLAAALRAWTGPGGVEVSLILLLDQFEELFVYHDGDPRAGGLGAELVDLLVPGAGAPRVHVLLSFREDALAQLDVFKPHLPGLFDTVLRVAPLTAEAAAAAITGPVERYNETAEAPVAVEPEVAAAILRDVETGRIALAAEGQGGVEARAGDGHVELPFLQLVLTRLWERERALGSDTLRLATYVDDLGGAEAIIRSHLDGALSALTPAQRDIAADVFRYLVTPSGTKYAIGSGDLARFAGRPETEVHAVLDALASSRRRVLRRIPPPEPGGESRYEVAHDRLGPAVLAWKARHVAEREADRVSAEQRARFARRAKASAAAFSGALLLMAGVVFAQSMIARQRAEEREQLEGVIAEIQQMGIVASSGGTYILRTDVYPIRLVRPGSRSETLWVSPPDVSSEWVAAAAFSPDERRLALVTVFDTLKLLATSGPGVPPEDSTIDVDLADPTYLSLKGEVQLVAFSPDGSELGIGTDEGELHVLRIEDLRSDSVDAIVSASFYPNPVRDVLWRGEGSCSQPGRTGPCALDQSAVRMTACLDYVYVARGRIESDTTLRQEVTRLVYSFPDGRVDNIAPRVRDTQVTGYESLSRNKILEYTSLNRVRPGSDVYDVYIGPYCDRGLASEAARHVDASLSTSRADRNGGRTAEGRVVPLRDGTTLGEECPNRRFQEMAGVIPVFVCNDPRP